MNAPAEGTNEPSIEEILDSIRQIISDDDDGGAVQKTASPQPPADDIIELTEKIAEQPPAQTIEPDAVIDMIEPESPPVPPVRVQPPEPPKPMPPPPPVMRHETHADTLLTQAAEEAAMRAFTELTHRAAIEKGGGITIEDVVRYEVRPLLRGWIDKHLPGIVERLVQKELEKISARFDQD